MNHQEFPYIKVIHVNDCYIYKNLDIAIVIRKGCNEVLHTILAWKDAKEKGNVQEEFVRRRGLADLLSRRASFTTINYAYPVNRYSKKVHSRRVF